MARGGEFIREARKRAGISQQELAERLGTTQSVIARWESGVRSPTVETLFEAVRACGLDVHVRLGTPDVDHDLFLRQNRRLTPVERIDRMVARLRGLDRLLSSARAARRSIPGDPKRSDQGGSAKGGRERSRTASGKGTR